MTTAFPQLQTERLVISLVDPADAGGVAEYYRSNRDHLEPFEPTRPESFFTEDHWRGQLQRNREEFAAGTTARFFISRIGEQAIIGTVSFTNVARGPAQFCNLGYGLAEEAQGKGYMSEALQAAIAYMFQEKGMHRIMANYMPHNVRSASLLRRLGFQVEGYARDYLQINGRWEDHILTSLTNSAWTAPA